MKPMDEEMMEELVWDYVSKYLEKIENLPTMLEDIGYVDDLDELIGKVDMVEDFDSEIEIEEVEESEDAAAVSFQIFATLSAWCRSKQLLRITVNAHGTCAVKASENIEMLDFTYDNVECDDVRDMM